MGMWITAIFESDGIPAVGLIPDIRIWEINTNNLVVSGTLMSEIGDGFYKYYFDSYDINKDYIIRCDSTLPGADRYAYVATGEYNEILSVINTNVVKVLGLSQENYYLDNTVYTDYQGAALLTSGRLRIYSDAAAVGTDNDVIATYQITSTWSDAELDTYKVVKI